MSANALEVLVIDEADQLHGIPFGQFERAEFVRLYGENLSHLAVAGEADYRHTPEVVAKIYDVTVESVRNERALQYGLHLAGELVGQVGMYIDEEANANLHYWVDRQHQGQKIGTRSVRAVAEQAFRRHDDLESLRLQIRAGNHRSRRLAETLGAVLTDEADDTHDIWRLYRGRQ